MEPSVNMMDSRDALLDGVSPSSRSGELLGIALETADRGGLLLIVGPPGSGRSYLLTQLSEELRRLGKDTQMWTPEASLPTHSDVILADNLEELSDADRARLTEALATQKYSAVIATMSTFLDDALMEWRDRLRRRGAQIFTVPPWSEAEMFALAHDLAPAGSTVTDVGGATGNPGLLRAILRSPLNYLVTGDAPPSSLPGVANAILPWFDRLDSGTRDLFHVAALCSEQVSVRALHHGCGQTDLDVFRFLARATDAGFLRAHSQGWTFTYPWLSALLAATRPQAEIQARHAIIAHGLISDGGPAHEIVFHVLQSADRSSRLMEWTLEEMTHRVSHDAHSVVNILEKLLGRSPARFPGQDRARNLLARAYAVAGKVPEVEQLVASSLADGLRRDERLPLLLHLSEALLRDDDVTRSVTVLESVTEEDAEGGSLERNQLIATRSLHRVLAGNLEVGEHEAQLALERGKALGDDLGVSISYSALAHVNYYRGYLQTAAELSRFAVRHADLSDSDEARRRSRYEMGMFLTHADHSDEAAATFEDEIHRYEGQEGVWHRPLPHVGLGLLAFSLGEWDRSLTHLNNAIILGEQVSTRWEATAARAHMAVISLERGNLGDATRLLDEADLADADSPHHCLDLVLWARALLSENLGQFSDAFELLESACSVVAKYGVLSRLRWLGPDLVRMGSKVGRLSDCRQVVDTLEQVAGIADTPYIYGAALRSRALLESDASLALQAVDVLATTRRKVELAAAQLDTARLLAQDGDSPDQIQRLMSDASAHYEAAGAVGRLLAIKTEARGLGLTVVAERRVRSTHRSGELTPTERRIAEYVAQGLSNPEIATALFISRRTVETHLTHVFAKLGVKSRVALALRAADGLGG